MVIYGTNSPKTKSSPFPNHQCTNCGREETHVIIRSHYFHVFWIPIIPFKKSLKIVCASCKHINKPSEVNQEIKAFTRELKSSVKHPWYAFSGLTIILLAIIFFNIQGYVQKKELKELVDNPAVGDIYLLKETNPIETGSLYGFAKVRLITEDSIYCSSNVYLYSTYVTQMSSDDGFVIETEAYSRNHFILREENDMLIKVFRDYNENSQFNKDIDMYGDDLAESSN